MLRKRMNALWLSAALMSTAFLLSSCSKTTEEAKSKEPAPRVEPAVVTAPLLPLGSPTPKPSPAKKSSVPPDPTEIRDAVARVFEKVATPDASRDPDFAVGDFNGDGSEDLAVVLKASESALGDLNNELANWVLEDPRNVTVDRTGLTTQKSPGKPVRAEKGDTLLAIIHGVGSQGWRAPEAKQTYVLKNGAGSSILVQSAQLVRNTKGKQKLPPLKGDVISETIGTRPGLLFWTGGRYAWYSSSPE